MDRVQQALATSAVELFITKGYAATSVDDVAQHAGVSRRTFFRYFATKEDALLRPILADIANFASVLEKRPVTESVAESLRAIALETTRPDDPHLPVVMRLYRAIRYAPELRGVIGVFLDHYRDAIAEWAAPRLNTHVGTFRVQLFAAAAVAARESSLKVWVESDGAKPLDELLDEAYRRLFAPEYWQVYPQNAYRERSDSEVAAG